jgi:hypothetical protein
VVLDLGGLAPVALGLVADVGPERGEPRPSSVRTTQRVLPDLVGTASTSVIRVWDATTVDYPALVAATRGT